jgi:uncharacterized MAPEG superfamily protein
MIRWERARICGAGCFASVLRARTRRLSCAVQAIAHIVLVSAFALMRLLHTISYMLKMQPVRTAVWMLAILCIVGMGINGIVAAFRIPHD